MKSYRRYFDYNNNWLFLHRMRSSYERNIEIDVCDTSDPCQLFFAPAYTSVRTGSEVKNFSHFFCQVVDLWNQLPGWWSNYDLFRESRNPAKATNQVIIKYSKQDRCFAIIRGHPRCTKWRRHVAWSEFNDDDDDDDDDTLKECPRIDLLNLHVQLLVLVL